jgi:hypothetical protein
MGKERKYLFNENYREQVRDKLFIYLMECPQSVTRLSEKMAVTSPTLTKLLNEKDAWNRASNLTIARIRLFLQNQEDKNKKI